MLLYRTLDWGALAQLQFLDTRQNRPHRTCDEVSEGKRIPADCAGRFDSDRSLLGRKQERWLQSRFRGTEARWNLLAQQYLMGELKLEDGRVSNDGWDGFVQTRRRVLEGWRDAKVSNPLVLGGDVHCFFAGELALEPGRRPIASEFVGGSISSTGRNNGELARAVANNPRLKFAEGERRGYGRVELTPGTCTVTFRAVDDALVPTSPVRDLATFVVEDGEAGFKRA
jgi:alkaline phosphatase D